MTLVELQSAILNHTGTFRCSRINHPEKTKLVSFRHQITAPTDSSTIPNVGGLQDFYSVFGSILFYEDAKSGDAARYLAPVEAWGELHECFSDWLSHLDPAERQEYVPEWIETCLVVGEEPNTGNYILIPTEGSEAGAVYHFEHDGFEFDRHADNLLQYTQQLLDLDSKALAYIATNMRFVEDEPGIQWWIEELSDSRGNSAKTNV